VRELRALLRERAGANGDEPTGDQTGHAPGDFEAASESEAELEPERARTLTVTALREDGWLFECARRVVERVAGPMSINEQLQALLVEGCSTLLELLPQHWCSELRDLEALEGRVANDETTQAAWCAELDRQRAEAERRCEGRWSSLPAHEAHDPGGAATAEHAEYGAAATPEELDRKLRRRFASEAQYARERVGVSWYSLKSRRTLSARLGRATELAAALTNGRIGYEAAYLLSRVVTRATAEAWLTRAEQRTVKHLREEVEAAELLIRTGRGQGLFPPDDADLEALFELERRIASGETLEQVLDAEVIGSPAGSVGRHPSAASQTSGASQSSGTPRPTRSERGFGRMTLRWTVTADTHRFWRTLERLFLRLRSRLGLASWSFLRFLSENFATIWLAGDPAGAPHGHG
jgi:hypothetical protein